ncbi:MAG: conjugal transfer protein TrbF [Sedimenticola sp.]
MVSKSSSNPYLDARREWNERYGDYISQAATWRMIAIISALVSLMAVGGALYLASQSKFIPYIVEIDRQGHATAVGPAVMASKADERVIMAMLADFISNWRSVTMDIEIQKRQVFDVYAHVSSADPAYTTLNEYFKSADPFQRARTEVVSVEVTSLLRLSESAWEVEWTERMRDRNGHMLKKSRHFKGALKTLLTKSSEDRHRLQVNPIGLYITELSWAEMLDIEGVEK